MRDTIWVVRDPQREIIGVGFNPINALYNVVPNTDYDTMDRFMKAVEHTGEDEFHHNGYTLTREALAAATRVRVLDEWTVVGRDGTQRDPHYHSQIETAKDSATWHDAHMVSSAPHRVVRVALVEM